VDDDQMPTDGKKKLFENFQKNRIVPNIASSKKRAPGISKGMWKKELKTQLGISINKKRSGKRTQEEIDRQNIGKRLKSQKASERKTGQ
jgi:hypothetical protein